MSEIKQVLIPDIGDFKDVPVIEVLVKSGDQVKVEDSLVTLESDKATIEVPAPYPGVITEVSVKTGDKVSEGSLILLLQVSDTCEEEAPDVSDASEQPVTKTPPIATANDSKITQEIIKEPLKPLRENKILDDGVITKVHAGPSVRRFARELGVNLNLVTGSGPKQRILKEDVQAYVKAELSKSQSSGDVGVAFNLLPWPQVDFAKFGPVELKSLTRIKQIAGANLHRNWVMIPHVTQFDEADITELEALRKESNLANKENNIKLTLLAFLMKAIISSLKKFPEFNASLDSNSVEANLIIKHYYHLGFAVDTVNGLVVPVIRDVDQKGVMAIAAELGALSISAREGKLKPTEMQGASFTISSLGGVGGTAFTPIVNAPEVAILGVSKASYKPIYRDSQFVPRLMLPLSLSYDHRVIDGASAARFTAHLAEVLSDMRLALL